MELCENHIKPYPNLIMLLYIIVSAALNPKPFLQLSQVWLLEPRVHL